MFCENLFEIFLSEKIVDFFYPNTIFFEKLFFSSLYTNTYIYFLENYSEFLFEFLEKILILRLSE